MKILTQINELLSEKKFNDFEKEETDSIPKVLKRQLSSKNCLSDAAYVETIYSSDSREFAKKIKMLFHLGFWPNKEFSPLATIDYLQNRFYTERISEMREKQKKLHELLAKEESKNTLFEYQKYSYWKLCNFLKSKFHNIEEKQFLAKSYRTDPTFLEYFPIVFSTTHSLQFCIPRGILFDYVIIDESSQVNLTSAFIALASARNAVIVGDSKQLPHVVPSNLKEPLDIIKSKFNPPDYFDYRKYSLLESIQSEYGNSIPNTLLNEHYRCDPEIIGFCNKRFYDSKLIVQTQHTKGCGIKIIETPSHTALGRTNSRQAEVIAKEILPIENDEIGIVAPYRDQVTLLQNLLQNKRILVDTVHKFQGKERPVIILSTTSDKSVIYDDPDHTDFLNDPNLINVAISRAKNRLYVIATREALNQEKTLLGDLSKYVGYHSESDSYRKTKTISVFDLMYEEYSPILQRMKERLLKISEFESENIIATIIDDICKSKKYGLLSFKFNYPLRKVIRIDASMSTEDKNFIRSPGSHCDFVIFDQLNKQIKLIVEVDGKQHESKIQKNRDMRKDRLITSSGLQMLRIRTTDQNAKGMIEAKL